MAQGSTARTRRRGGLLSETRRRKILDWLQEEGSARVSDLSEAFEVSEVTIRQDLERLESEGHITREYGGAFLNTLNTQVASLSLQHSENMDKKRKIGALARLPLADMEERLRAAVPVDAAATRALAVQRARAVRDALIAKGLGGDRLFLTEAKVDIAATDNGTIEARARLALSAD
jgi:DNA-binding transcriptional ArsR family regulator